MKIKNRDCRCNDEPVLGMGVTNTFSATGILSRRSQPSLGHSLRFMLLTMNKTKLHCYDNHKIHTFRRSSDKEESLVSLLRDGDQRICWFFSPFHIAYYVSAYGIGIAMAQWSPAPKYSIMSLRTDEPKNTQELWMNQRYFSDV